MLKKNIEDRPGLAFPIEPGTAAYSVANSTLIPA